MLGYYKVRWIREGRFSSLTSVEAVAVCWHDGVIELSQVY